MTIEMPERLRNLFLRYRMRVTYYQVEPEEWFDPEHKAGRLQHLIDHTPLMDVRPDWFTGRGGRGVWFYSLVSQIFNDDEHVLDIDSWRIPYDQSIPAQDKRREAAWELAAVRQCKVLEALHDYERDIGEFPKTLEFQ